jgi:transcriptional regulator with XRE-family HTH domain
MPGLNHFAERLRSIREAAGLSQYEVARRTGLSRETLSKLEQGDREPGWETVQLLAHVLGVACTEFMDPGVKPPVLEAPAPRGRPKKEEPEAPAAPKPKGKRKG